MARAEDAASLVSHDDVAGAKGAASAEVARRPTRRRGGTLRLYYVGWTGLFVILWLTLLYLSAGLAGPDEPDKYWIVVFPILSVITVASSLPILLLVSFFHSERNRALDSALTDAEHNGWDADVRHDILDWYERVFDERRYPMPATLALLTFVFGWLLVFFHSGPLVNQLLSGGLADLFSKIGEGPPLVFGFLGSYFFGIWFLFQRYISGDLGPSAYLHVAVRTWVVIILVTVVDALIDRSADGVPVPIEAIAFVGALVPSALLAIIWGVATSAGRWMRRDPENEVPITAIQGMNAWKAARLAEEGIENVQNLAMEPPSRLIVTTREGGLRILDWIDQAILYNAATPEVRKGLAKVGIRTAYDLMLALKTLDLIEVRHPKFGAPVYEVALPPADAFADIPHEALRYVAAGVLHHPNFENVQRMREQARLHAFERVARD